MYHANINPKKAGMNILISDKVDGKENCQTMNAHYIMMKG